MMISLAVGLMALVHIAASIPPPARSNSALSLLPLNLTDSVDSPFLPQAVVCYDERYAHASNPPTYRGCQDVIEYSIATGPRPDLWHAFSRRPDPKLQSRVPKRWIDGRRSCTVLIDVPHTVAEEASLTEIQAAARTILMQCVLGGWHLGGFTYIGRRGALLVSVVGDDDS
ncbi:MAG: hypothetical protein Q9178_000479 [Gyalolechia marmorata]